MKEVSVVIPSYNRHEEVICAVRSALAQTQSPREVIVSNDGPDPEKAKLLEALNDSRVQYVEAPRRRNASATRNFGVQHAGGDWIALLDDDDIWLPGKLEAQFAALDRVGMSEAILAGIEVVYADGRRSHVRPAIAVPADVPVCQVLFCGYGGAHTSTLVAPRWVFAKYVFNEMLERHEDWSWLLHAGQEIGLLVAPEEVCERRLAPGEGLSRPGGYQFSRQWYQQHKSLMTRPARAAFVATILSRKASHDRTPRALAWLICEMGRQSGINPKNIVKILTPWFISAKTRRAINVVRMKQ